MSTKILVADDSITIQKVIGIIFGGEEYSLTVVDNGKAALDKARETLPDILLIDALMPGMSGYEACEQIRAVPELAGKPILLMTGSFEPFDETKAHSCGADDFIAKPFEAQQIVTKVQELIAGASSRVVAPTAQAVAPPSQTQPSADVFADLVPSAPPAFAAQPVETVAPVFTAPVEPAFAMSAPPAEATFASTTPLAAAFTAPAAPASNIASVADDIWGAFTAAAEPAPAAAIPKPAPAPDLEPDVFAIASEEPSLQHIPATEPSQSAQPAGSSWPPMEDQAFEFASAPPATPPAPSTSIPLQPMDENAFDEVSFADTFQPEPAPPTASAAQTGFDVLEAMEPLSGFQEHEPVIAMPAAAAAGQQATDSFAAAPAIAEAGLVASQPAVELSEEQLKTAISAASKEVIERIVWEVVPDLAEAMIREAIRKIKEGV